jgi:hypothetical protein
MSSAAGVPLRSAQMRPGTVRTGTACRARLLRGLVSLCRGAIHAPFSPNLQSCRASTPTVNLTPLYATLTKIEGGLYRTATSFVGAQHAAPLTPRLPIRPPAAATPCPRREPTPTVSLTPLYAMLTKTRGVLIES